MGCPDGLTRGFDGLDIQLRRAICYLWVDFGSDGIGSPIIRPGTGMMFENSQKGAWIVTGAHLLYHHEYRRFAHRISVYFGRYGDSYFTPINMVAKINKNIFVPSDFVNNSEPIPHRDFGLIRASGVPNDMLSIPIKHMSNVSSRRYMLLGYPDEGACKGKRIPYNSIVKPAHATENNIGYQNQTTYAGMSGGPLLAKEKTDKGEHVHSFGLHIRGQWDSSGTIEHRERAIRFNRKNFALFRRWMKS